MGIKKEGRGRAARCLSILLRIPAMLGMGSIRTRDCRRGRRYASKNRVAEIELGLEVRVTEGFRLIRREPRR